MGGNFSDIAGSRQEASPRRGLRVAGYAAKDFGRKIVASSGFRVRSHVIVWTKKLLILGVFGK
jgi:hypothetical protein